MIKKLKKISALVAGSGHVLRDAQGLLEGTGA
jgi:hypothetical protein